MGSCITEEKNQQSTFESFFITVFDSKTSRKTSYLKLPTSNCFTYCIKEIIHTLKNELQNNKIAEHSQKLITNFYEFMSNDIVLRQSNYLAYARILLELKSMTEGNAISITDKIAFFEHANAHYSKKYSGAVYELLLKFHSENEVSEKSLNIINLFINELLADGNNYLFLTYILKQYKSNKFTSFTAFIDYLYYGNNDSFDILIPIKELKFTGRELFELKEQKIEERDDVTYCKVYDNKTIDFFYLIKENLIRIESLFNILRLYKNSNIDFLREKNIIVNSKYFNEEFEISFDEINKYTGPTPYVKNLIPSVENLDKLKELNKPAYHSILNTISYAEKDKDVMTPSSFVDNWIAIESLMSLSGRKKGFVSVEFILPKMLSAKIILSDATNTLENAYKNYAGPDVKLENFIKQVCENTFDFNKIKNPYFCLELKKLAEIFSSPKKLQEQFAKVEKLLSLDLLRIYILRNEYVHASNLQAFNSMQQIKLKHLLPLSIDEFFKIFNNRIGKDIISFDLIFDIFTEILIKYDIRQTSFKLINDKVRLTNGKLVLDLKIEDLDIPLDKYIFNVLKNNNNLFKNYVPKEFYN